MAGKSDVPRTEPEDSSAESSGVIEMRRRELEPSHLACLPASFYGCQAECDSSKVRIVRMTSRVERAALISEEHQVT